MINFIVMVICALSDQCILLVTIHALAAQLTIALIQLDGSEK